MDLRVCVQLDLALLHFPCCVKWYQSKVFLDLMAPNGDGVECSNGGSRGKDAMWATIEEQRQHMNEIQELLVVVGLELNANRLQKELVRIALEILLEDLLLTDLWDDT